MPYRGTNAKRQVVHDKSRGTIKSGSRDHFLSEKKEHEHELSLAKENIAKFHNDGFRYHRREEHENKIRIVFVNDQKEEKELMFIFPDNVDTLKEYFSNLH